MSTYADAVRRPPRTLDEREVAALLKTTGQHKDGFRDHVIFSLALATGLREHELLALDNGDVFTDRGWPRRVVCLRTFKRSNDDVNAQEVRLSEGARAKLEKFRAWKRAAGESLDDDAPLFVSARGERLSDRMLRHAFRTWQERAGFDRRFTFHALRHTACTNLYRRTKDIRLTQRFARHRSVLSTTIYTHASDDDLARAVEDLPC